MKDTLDLQTPSDASSLHSGSLFGENRLMIELASWVLLLGLPDRIVNTYFLAITEFDC